MSSRAAPFSPWLIWLLPVASNSHGQLALAVNANISFLSSKSSGTLYATATELGEPKRLGAYDVLITDELGEIIARFNGMVYRKKQNLFSDL